MNKQKSNVNLYKEILSYAVILILAVLLSAHLSVVVSGSMEPSFYRGDIVATENVDTYGIQEFNPYTDVNVNDVVVYNAKWYSEPVIHRVIDIQQINGSKYYIIKGDNNEVQDPYPVSPDQIKSKVIKIGDSLLIIPKLGYITLLFRGL
ncbi:MAG: signal peptidase I [Methanosphaera sp.]|uniref:signal peptidase I n=1 Tax=Methanosphaera sp. TaxID=2666342 RepID=UPI002E7A3C80|nr:signal peptidase I [Methanosphaera sp.]MEE1117206.1 signal peptidase I [Methanosphaera sp.]MEE3324114.1 signal peptidase I [Methanosphaera sp.]MEE3418262.1 signal peptidase I [Methanosphaera sp.]